MRLPFIMFSMWALSASCSETKFSSGTPSSAVSAEPEHADAVPATTESEAAAPCKQRLDIIKAAFPANVGACYESGRVWNFGTQECVQMKAARFECKWGPVKEELAKIGINNNAVNTAAENPIARLVGCGQSQDGNRIVVQWVNLPAPDTACSEIPPGSAVTGCFTHYVNEAPPAAATTQEEKDKRNYACMSQL